MSSEYLKKFQAEAVKYGISTAALVIANIVPLFGVIFFGWSTFALVSLYWAENVVIGIINVLKMITSNPDATAGDLEGFLKGKSQEQRKADLEKLAGQERTLQLFHHLAKVFLVPFFVLHYGAFCAVHGMFIFFLLSGQKMAVAGPTEIVPHLVRAMVDEGLFWALAGLAASHLVSFVSNFLYGGEYRRTFAMGLMKQPYGRVMALHFAILLGAFAIAILGQPVWMLVILIVGKTTLDLKLHLAERKKNRQKATVPDEPVLAPVVQSAEAH